MGRGVGGVQNHPLSFIPELPVELLAATELATNLTAAYPLRGLSTFGKLSVEYASLGRWFRQWCRIGI